MAKAFSDWSFDGSSSGSSTSNSKSGFFGMDPLIGSTLLNMGGGLFSGLASLFGGGGDEKRFNQTFGQARRMMGKPILDINAYTSRLRRGALPRMNQMGRDADKRFGLDSGIGYGGLMEKYLNMESGMQGDAMMQEAQMRTQRDTSLMGQMLQAAAAARR